MLPYWVIISIYYLIAKSDATMPHPDGALTEVKQKNFLALMLDGLFGCWFGDNSYTIASWTLSVELWASLFVYLLA